MKKIPGGRKVLCIIAGMPFTVPDPREVDNFIKSHHYDLNKQSGKRRTKKEWESKLN